MEKTELKEKVILGEGCVYSTDCKETGLNNNIIVCGSSGCGKTMSISEPRLLATESSSLIAAVAKRKLVNKYKPLFESRGYEVCDLDFASPERGNTGYDPLAFVKSPADITFIASSIVKADPKKKHSRTDPFWDESAISLLSAEIAYVLCKNENASFADVLDMNAGIDLAPPVRGDMAESSYNEKFRELEKMYVKKTPSEEKEKADPYDGLKARDMIRAWEEIEEGRYRELKDADGEKKWEFARRRACQIRKNRQRNFSDTDEPGPDDFLSWPAAESIKPVEIDTEDFLFGCAGEDVWPEYKEAEEGSFPADSLWTDGGVSEESDEKADEENLTEIDESRANLAAFAVSCWNTFRGAAARTAACIYSQLNTILDRIFSPEIRKMMRLEKQVDFEGLAQRRSILFVTASPVNLSQNFFINMFYAHAIKQFFEFAEKRPDGVLPVPVHILCDDFAAGGRIFNFPEYISIFREKGISVTLLLQSESQLASMYGADDAVTIINNCDSYVYMGGMDFNTAKNVSLRLDAPYDEILALKAGEEIVFRRGQRPVRTQRYDINRSALYQEVTRRYEERINSAEI